MTKNSRVSFGIVMLAFLVALLYASSMAAQVRTSDSAGNGMAAGAPASDEQLAATKQNLFNLLQMSPKLAGAVANDPSLVGDQEYVNRSNPELAKFLQNHPEVARNPEFYLFGNFADSGKSSRRVRVDRGMVSFETSDPGSRNTEEFLRHVVPLLVFLCVVGALLWLLRVLLENRRWSRLFNAQTGIYNKLLDRFGNNDELLAYVRDDAGKRFLESLALPSSLWSFSRSPITRILAPLQLGVVFTMAGAGLIASRGGIPDAAPAFIGMLWVFGILTFMVGIGFIISAGLSFLLARRLGLMSPAPSQGQGGSSLDTRDHM